MENKKVVKVTRDQLQKIINEGVAKLHKKTLIENRIKKINEELYNIGKPISEVFYGDSDGDYDFDKSQGVEADDLYEKGREMFNQGDTSGAEEMRQKALTKGSWLGWGEVEFPPYTNKVFDNMMGNPLDNMDFLGENDEVASPTIMSILNSYLEAALWTEEDEIGPANIESDVSNNAKIDAYKDVKEFLSQAGSLVDGIDPEQIGHDLWLTRNGHGAGFWDRGLGKVGDELSNIANSMGSKHVYIGDDGEIHID